MIFPSFNLILGVAAGAVLITNGRAGLTVHQITSEAADGEARQSSTGAYSIAQGTPNTHLRVGFQNLFGSNGQPFGGLNAVWFFKLPRLEAASGESVESADFVTTLLDENAATPVTPRFNADLYALGFTATAGAVADEIHFFAGQDQSGAGLGSGQSILKIDDDFFTVFTDWESVNTPTPKLPKAVATDSAGRAALLAVIQGVYANPAFPNTGNEFLVLRLSADRAAGETYEENGFTQFYGNGVTRYKVATSESAGLTGTDPVDYTNVIPTRLTLTIRRPDTLFQITRFQYHAATGQTSLTWDSVPGRTYALSSSLDLAAFNALNPSIPAAADVNETTYSFVHSPPAGSTRSFFRITLNPQALE